jgi:16S rRNA (guanine(966)-N(2))-methyltransferase RsmD
MKTNLRLIGGKRLLSPNNIFTRPTTLRVREAIFNILKNRVENSNWLDLFSGTGAISCEAYNHGARKIVAIEKNKNNSKICLKNLFSLQNIESRKKDIDVICKDVLNWTKPNYERSLSSKIIDLDQLKFDFVYLDPPYNVNFHELVLNQIFNCNFLKKDSIVICEHSPKLFIKKNSLWETLDVRDYGQSRLTFLINVQNPRPSSVLIPCTYK